MHLIPVQCDRLQEEWCGSYFSVAVLKHHDPKQLLKEFISACGFRGMHPSWHGGDWGGAWQQGAGTLAGTGSWEVTSLTVSAEERVNWKRSEVVNSQACPQWLTSPSKASHMALGTSVQIPEPKEGRFSFTPPHVRACFFNMLLLYGNWMIYSPVRRFIVRYIISCYGSRWQSID